MSPMALPKPETFDDLAKVLSVWRDEEQRIRAIVNRLGPEGITRPIEYQGWDGKRQAQPFWQILQHLVNHGSYHRGQVTTMLRQLKRAAAEEHGSDRVLSRERERDHVGSGFSRTRRAP